MNEFLTVKQVAERLQVNPRTITRYINQGIIQAIKIGRVWRIPISEFNQFIEHGGIELKGGVKISEFTKEKNGKF